MSQEFHHHGNLAMAGRPSSSIYGDETIDLGRLSFSTEPRTPTAFDSSVPINPTLPVPTDEHGRAAEFEKQEEDHRNEHGNIHGAKLVGVIVAINLAVFCVALDNTVSTVARSLLFYSTHIRR